MEWYHVLLAVYALGTLVLIGPPVVYGRCLYQYVGFSEQYRASVDLLAVLPICTTLHICSGCLWMIVASINLGCKRSTLSPRIHRMVGCTYILSAVLCSTTAPVVTYYSSVYTRSLLCGVSSISIYSLYCIRGICRFTDRCAHIDYVRRTTSLGIGSVLMRPVMYGVYTLCMPNSSLQQYLVETRHGYNNLFYFTGMFTFSISYFVVRWYL